MSALSWFLAGWLLMALAWPAGSGPAAPAWRQPAIAWLHAQQLPDGSFGQRMAEGQYVGSAGATADVVYVLGLLGEDPGSAAWTVQGHSALEALARLAPDFARADAGQAGKVARAVAAAGHDVRSFGGLDLAQIIQGFYDPGTGRYSPELLFRHTLALEGLLRAGIAVPAAALDALWQARQPDGGWFWSFKGEQSDVDTTGRALQVLAVYGHARCAPALLPAVDYLAAHQDPAGGWGASNPAGPPNANSTAMAVGGLQALGYVVSLSDRRFARAGRSALDQLLAFQETGGAFVYIPAPGREEVRLAATVDALTALAEPDTGVACNLTYLPVEIVR